jgi:hypothetical protein
MRMQRDFLLSVTLAPPQTNPEPSAAACGGTVAPSARRIERSGLARSPSGHRSA